MVFNFNFFLETGTIRFNTEDIIEYIYYVFDNNSKLWEPRTDYVNKNFIYISENYNTTMYIRVYPMRHIFIYYLMTYLSSNIY